MAGAEAVGGSRAGAEAAGGGRAGAEAAGGAERGRGCGWEQRGAEPPVEQAVLEYLGPGDGLQLLLTLLVGAPGQGFLHRERSPAPGCG